eukprot:gene21065-23119_t
MSSSTRSRRTYLNPTEIAKMWIRKHEDQDGLEKRFISPSIGWGVIAMKSFEKGSFLLQYIGETVSREEGENREKKYEKKKLGYYLYFFSSKGKEPCIDATLPTPFLGRLVNDSNKPNCVMKLVANDNVPHLCLFAIRDIQAGEELRYDYDIVPESDQEDGPTIPLVCCVPSL